MFRNTVVRKSILLLAAFLAFSLLVGAGVVVAQEGDDGVQTEATELTVYEVIAAEPELSSFQALIDAAALNDNLQEDGPFTVFAPTNTAWAAFNAAVEAEAEVDMTDILLYHVVNGEYHAADLAEGEAITTLGGEFLFFSPSENNEGETTIVLNENVAVVRSIEASNGVVHIVDTVVSIPEVDSALGSDQGSPNNSIVEVLANDGRFDTLLSLLEEAGLMEELENSTARYTLFAPTDEAFEAADPVLLEEWLANPTEDLYTILSYHVIGDRLTINQIANDDYLPTLEGRAIAVTTDEDITVYLNGRPISDANVLASNGIIHVVDEVVLP
jgi:uncharacterized surface protein with fasciclin (FAS1) repeats